jgi:Protein of unknown function (DUF4232)
MSDRTVYARRAATLTLLSAGVVLMLAGCNPDAQSVSATVGATSSASTPASTGQGAAPATVAQAAVAECKLTGLTISLGTALPPGAPGISQRPIIFRNTGAAACFVVGFPGVAALGGDGSQIYQAARVNSPGPRITLQPGQDASAMLDTVYQLSSPCPTVPALLVTAPDETHSREIAFAATVCAAPTITTLAAGTNGGDATQAQSQFSEAQQLWKTGATADSAEQGAYWSQAASLLTNAVQSGAAGTAGFSKAAQELTQLASLPDAMQSAAQQSEATQDTALLNTFFDTPGLYS